jgi:hypothetical protein
MNKQVFLINFISLFNDAGAMNGLFGYELYSDILFNQSWQMQLKFLVFSVFTIADFC